MALTKASLKAHTKEAAAEAVAAEAEEATMATATRMATAAEAEAEAAEAEAAEAEAEAEATTTEMGAEAIIKMTEDTAMVLDAPVTINLARSTRNLSR